MANKVLCIEDEELIAELYARALNIAGYEVVIEHDGIKGLSQAQTGYYDVILLDLMLPGMSGLDILKTLRDPNKSPTFDSKIIVITNLDEPKPLQVEIERQVEGYLIKAAITPRQLVEFVEKVVPPTANLSPMMSI
jgi:DNA-binding response OmpR family regulator